MYSKTEIAVAREGRTTGGEHLQTTYSLERQKWDSLAHEHGTKENLLVQEDFHACARRSSTMPGISEFLGDLRDKRVLEYGCGLGQMTVRLAKSGAQVTAFDLSESSIEVARQRAIANGVIDRVAFDVCPAENLPYDDETFDVVFGKAVLHHLHLASAQPHLARVLKTGGKAAFAEPMGMNPILNFVREYVHYPGKNPRGADRPLNYDEIHGWARGFRSLEFRELQLLSMLERGLGFDTRLRVLRRLDSTLLRRFPRLRRYCRYVVMLMTK